MVSSLQQILPFKTQLYLPLAGRSKSHQRFRVGAPHPTCSLRCARRPPRKGEVKPRFERKHLLQRRYHRRHPRGSSAHPDSHTARRDNLATSERPFVFYHVEYLPASRAVSHPPPRQASRCDRRNRECIDRMALVSE